MIVHAYPRRDEIEHELREDCPCGPTPEFVQGAERSGFVYHHHSLDGRERRENLGLVVPDSWTVQVVSA